MAGIGMFCIDTCRPRLRPIEPVLMLFAPHRQNRRHAPCHPVEPARSVSQWGPRERERKGCRSLIWSKGDLSFLFSDFYACRNPLHRLIHMPRPSAQFKSAAAGLEQINRPIAVAGQTILDLPMIPYGFRLTVYMPVMRIQRQGILCIRSETDPHIFVEGRRKMAPPPFICGA